MNTRNAIRKSFLPLAFVAVMIATFCLALQDDQILQFVQKVAKDVTQYALISVIVAIFLTYFYNKYISDALSQSKQSKREKIEMKAMRARHERLEEKVRKLTAELSAANIKLDVEIENHPQDQRELHQRLKHLNCLYGLSKIVNRQEIPLEDIFQKTVCLIREAYRYPTALSVRIIFDGIRYETADFKKSELSRYAKIQANDKDAGMLEVYYCLLYTSPSPRD